MISTADSSEHDATANQILTTVRLLREKLATESTEANQKLTTAIMDAVLYAEEVENSRRLLALADTCVGRIRSRMRAHRIPIHPPWTSSDITPMSDVNGPVAQGVFFLPSTRTSFYD